MSDAEQPKMVPVEFPPPFIFNGPPVTPELQALLRPYGQSDVVGIVQLPDGLQVGYANGVQLTFVPFHSGGRIGGSCDNRGLAGAQIISGCCG